MNIITEAISKINKTSQPLKNLMHFMIGFAYGYIVLGLSYKIFIRLHHSSDHAVDYALLTFCVLTAIIVLINFEQKRTS